MKRISIAAGAVLLIALAVGLTYQPAQATQILERHLKYITTQVPALPDSEFKIRGATGVAAMTAQPIDTTQWTPLWDVIQIPESARSLAADSVTAVICIVPENPFATATAGPTAAADTITVSFQVSMNGVDPVACTNATFANPWLETSSNNAVYWPITLSYAQCAANGTTPTAKQLACYRFVRFIVTGDKVGAYSAIWKIPVPDGTLEAIGRKMP